MFDPHTLADLTTLWNSYDDATLATAERFPRDEPEVAARLRHYVHIHRAARTAWLEVLRAEGLDHEGWNVGGLDLQVTISIEHYRTARADLPHGSVEQLLRHDYGERVVENLLDFVVPEELDDSDRAAEFDRVRPQAERATATVFQTIIAAENQQDQDIV
ncbi:hypothetical protein GCM10027294_52990 [Marinactinospora endophytica]